MTHVPEVGGPYALEDVAKARTKFLAARGRFLRSKPLLTLAEFLNAEPHLQRRSAHRVIEAINEPEMLISVPLVSMPLPERARVGRSMKEASVTRKLKLKLLMDRIAGQVMPEVTMEPCAMDDDERTSADTMWEIADQLCSEALAKRRRPREG